MFVASHIIKREYLFFVDGLKYDNTLRPRIICRSIFWQCNMQFQTEVKEISLVVSPHSYQRIFQILG